MITWGLEGVGVLEAVTTELNSTGCQLSYIYINQSPNQYSQEWLFQYSESCNNLLWKTSMNEDLSIHRFILSHFASSSYSWNCKADRLSSFFVHLHHLEVHCFPVEWTEVKANLTHHFIHSSTLKQNSLNILECIILEFDCL